MRGSEPGLPKWPFLLGDVVLLGAAFFIYRQSELPMAPLELALGVVCILGGAIIAVVPFLLEHRAKLRLAESAGLATTVEQIKNLESIAAQISTATSRWKFVQESSEKTAGAASSIAQRISTEVKSFTDLLQKANDNEKSTLRLEVDKLRRGESEWLQTVVRLMDHVHALALGAQRSGQPNVIDQVAKFQHACRDAVRRMGVTPYTAAPDELFDAEKHQLLKEAGTPSEGSRVEDTIATGYTFQGRLLRPALVRLKGDNAAGEHSQPGPDKPTGEIKEPAGSTGSQAS